MSRTHGVLSLIFIVALGLRLVGINHGFPFIFHPDEPTIVRSALGVRFFTNPGHFDWPHFYIYANYFGYMGFATVRDLITSSSYHEMVRNFAPIIYDDRLIFYLLTRIFSAFLGAATVIPIFLTGKRLFGEKVGFMAALALALLPFHIRHSHYSLADVPMVFLYSWVIYFASGILLRQSLSDYLWAGLFSGLAASTKYNGGLSVLSIVLAHFLVYKLSFKDIHKLVLAGFYSIVGFVIGTPFAVLDYKTFLRTDGPAGALWQFTNVGSRSFIDRITNTLYLLVTKIPADMGYAILIGVGLIMLGLVFNKFRGKRHQDNLQLIFLIIPFVLLVFYIGGFQKSRSHYLMIIYPYAAVIFGYFVVKLMEMTEARRQYLPYITTLLVLTPLFYFGITSSLVFYNGDTRQQFSKWGKENFNSIFPIMFSDSSARVVLKTFAKNIYKIPEGEVNVPEGFLYSQDESFPAEMLYDKARILNLLYEIDNTHFNGPNIKFYSYSL